MSETLTAVAEEEELAENDTAEDEEEVRFIPPPALIAALSAAWAAYDAAKAAGLPEETIEYFDEGIDLVLDAIDTLRWATEGYDNSLEDARPAEEVFAEIDAERAAQRAAKQKTAPQKTAKPVQKQVRGKNAIPTSNQATRRKTVAKVA